MKVYEGEVCVSEQEGGYCTPSLTIGDQDLAEQIAFAFGGHKGTPRAMLSGDPHCGLVGEVQCGRLRITVERLPD